MIWDRVWACDTFHWRNCVSGGHNLCRAEAEEAGKLVFRQVSVPKRGGVVEPGSYQAGLDEII